MTRRSPLPQIPNLASRSLLSLLIAASFSGAQAQQVWVADKLQADGDAATVIEGEQLSGRPDREIQLRREVEITRGQTVINADDVHFDIVDDRVDAQGDVRVLREGNRFRGNSLKLKLDTGVGTMDSPVYKLLNRNAQGRAERIDFESEDSATVVNGIYTTCNGPDPDWYLKTGRLTLDDGAGIGQARSAVLVFKGVPIAGTPSISFPLTESRQSGFLAPTFSSSTNTGLQVVTPYYWDIAPNRDITLMPRYMSTRGLMLGIDTRYLERDYAGETRVEFMNDSAHAESSRYAISARHNQTLAPGVGLAIDFNRASDNDYPTDFPFSHVFDKPGMNRRLLPESGTVSYDSGGAWYGSFRLSDFQVLQDPNATIVVPYARLPQISLNYAEYSDSGFSTSMASQYTHFVHPTEVQGDRLVVNPRITYDELQGQGYFIRPSLSAHATLYNLDGVTTAGMNAPSRVLPTLSVDSGLIFERGASFFGRDVTQTLEPRAFYTYTPYVAQNADLYPNFDTSVADLSYAQVFRENRFVGNDRIGDANQMTLAMTSRYLESDGAERLRLALAQRFNFTPAKVGLGSELAGTADEKSDMLLLASGRISRETRVEANFQYNQTLNEINRVNVGYYWQPEPMKVVNAQYRRDSRNLADIPNTKYELADLSAQWPIASRWYGVGRINYLLDEKRVGQALAGIEHQADCWIFRMVAQRVPTAAGVTNTMIFFQLELSGLSSLGMNPMRALRVNVPGYQALGQPEAMAQ